jgi:hypothetical protein
MQAIKTSLKLHPVDPVEQNQTILQAMNDSTRNVTDIMVFSKNAQPIVKGGQLYLKILASFEGRS